MNSAAAYLLLSCLCLILNAETRIEAFAPATSQIVLQKESPCFVGIPRSCGSFRSYPIRPTFSVLQESIGTYESNDDDSDKNETSLSSSSIILLVSPAIMSLLAFSTYSETAKAFRTLVDFLSGHTWESVDGGAYLSDLIAPALTGPVSSFISLLFGTLTSMTVGNLYVRQSNMARSLCDILEDLRLIDLHTATLPTAQYREESSKLIQAYGALMIDNLEDSLSAERVKERREASRRILEQHMQLLHRVSEDKNVKDSVNSRAMDEAYSTLNRLIRTRNDLITTYENAFPIWHYGNLTILAMAILFIFLVLTDKTALLFLGGFQLRVCWAMLIGTFSMLAVVVYDLNNPLSGAFQIAKPTKLTLSSMQLEEFVDKVAEEQPKKVLDILE